MARTKTRRISVGLERRTVDRIDSIANSFDDFVSRGEVIDLLVSYIDDQDLEDQVFGGPEGETADSGPI